MILITMTVTALLDSLNVPEDASYDEENKVLKAWCKENNAYYYGRPGEDFCEQEAVRLAQEAGCTRVILESLS